MNEEKHVIKRAHNISIEGRAKTIISGVSEVESFNENEIILMTDMGSLEIKGNDLHINKLSVEDGNLQIEGVVISCIYSKSQEKSVGKGFFGKLFK